ncbi:MAG: PD40 domain-containing protein, partial [Acidobacteria bacterium]|nr:PD40 domain-containing protein [Acidobacteriota bacterium]
GAVKVLDFGLAKLNGPAEAGPSPSDLVNSPTITSPAAMTRMGVILGTAAYMSPEQAKGKPVDRAADLWAFGAVLYEMLAGKVAFDGETVTDVLAAIIMRDPDWTALPPATPPSIVRLLRRCLDRDRRRRLADAGEARFQIEEALAGPGNAGSAHARATRRGALAWAPWAIAAAALAVAVVALAWPRDTAPAASMTHVSLEAPRGGALSTVLRPALAISPDGSSVVFVATVAGVDRLYVRDGHQFDARVLEGTEGASHPDISPDGRWVAFIAMNKLYKVPIGGGAKTELATVNDPRGLSWDLDDAILVTPQSVGGIITVPAAGGRAGIVTTPVSGTERTHRWPQMLPGGRAVMFTVGDFANPDNYYGAKIDVQILATGERRTVLHAAEMARYSASGHLIFARAGALFSVPFDPVSLAAGDAPQGLLQGLAGDSTTGAAHFDISPAGTLAYIAAGGDQALTRPAWVDRAGRIEFLEVPAGVYTDPSISPDGRRIAVSVVAGGGRDIWIYHVDRKTFTRTTFGGQNVTPLWSADGSWIYFASLDPSDSSSTIWRRRADGSRDAEPVVFLPHRLYLNALSRDGRHIIFDHSHAATKASDIALVPLLRDAVSTPIVATNAEEFTSRPSPDGRWLAYESNESSRSEIYVRPADPGASGRWQVSTTGGREPKWSRDGRSLYYRFDNQLFSVAIESTPAFENRTPVQVLSNVYDPRIETGVAYDVHPDGRFLMIRLADENAVSDSIRLILNAFDEIRKIGSGK